MQSDRMTPPHAMTDPQPILAQLTTAPNPGAVAIIHLHGQALPLLVALTGRNDWPIARLQLARFGELDEGLAVRLSGDAAQLMPHGGPRVVQKLMERLSALGAVITGESPAEAIYPEAGSPIEADVLAAIAAAASPAAIDLLAAQPANWRAWFAADSATRPPLAPASLRHLLTPPTVALVGPANVGKSTLTNRLLGRSVSIVADLPGTTRDWVAGLVELPAAPPEPAHDESDAPPTSPSDPTRHAVAVRWLDTPGLRQSGDAVEQRAIALAARVVRSADVLIAIRERAGDWPSPDTLPRTPDLRVVTKIDQPGPDPEPDAIAVSGTTGQGLDALQQAILKALGLARLPSPQTALWPFSDRLRDAMQAESDTRLAAYLGCAAS